MWHQIPLTGPPPPHPRSFFADRSHPSGESQLCSGSNTCQIATNIAAIVTATATCRHRRRRHRRCRHHQYRQSLASLPSLRRNTPRSIPARQQHLRSSPPPSRSRRKAVRRLKTQKRRGSQTGEDGEVEVDLEELEVTPRCNNKKCLDLTRRIGG